MYFVNVRKVRGKMGEKGYNATKLASELNLSRNTVSNYLEDPSKIPYRVLSDMACLLCDSDTEAREIFFASKLT